MLRRELGIEFRIKASPNGSRKGVHIALLHPIVYNDGSRFSRHVLNVGEGGAQRKSISPGTTRGWAIAAAKQRETLRHSGSIASFWPLADDFRGRDASYLAPTGSPEAAARVLLNLISNGFYAATKRKVQVDGDGYEPTLAAATKNLGAAWRSGSVTTALVFRPR